MIQDKNNYRNTFSFQEKLFFALWSLLLGIVIRFPYLVPDDSFPLGDGGLFVAMINSIKSNYYLLPETVFYNNIQIPFAYPPLGFYLAILTSIITGYSTLWTMRFLPIIFNLLTIVSVAFLASEIVKNRSELFSVVNIFPIIFQSYEWLIKGGGVTRSPSLFFMTLSLLFTILYQKQKKSRFILFLICSLSGAIMSHAEWGLIAVISIPVYLFTHGLKNWRESIKLFALVGLSSLILTSPWWLTVISRFGVNPFFTAKQSITSHDFFSRLFDGSIFAVTVNLSDNYFIPAFAMTGLVISIIKRDFFLPIWLLSIYIVNSRNAPKNEVIPITFLAAIGLQGIAQLISLLISYLNNKNKFTRIAQWTTKRHFLNYLFILILLVILMIKWEYKPLIHPISQKDRVAMNFIKEATPADAKFIVLTPSDWFAADSAEWFPYLSNRHSLTTPQGLEWVSSKEFRKISSITFELSTMIHNELINNNSHQITLCQFIESRFTDFDYVVVFIKNINSDFGGFLESGRYTVFYKKSGVVIFSAN